MERLGSLPPRVSVTRWEKGRSKRGVNPTHMISWHTPLTPLSEVAKAITGEQGIKKVIKQLLRAGCGTRPSREGRAEGGVGYKGPLIFIRAATRLPGALFDRRPQPGARLWLQLRDPPHFNSGSNSQRRPRLQASTHRSHDVECSWTSRARRSSGDRCSVRCPRRAARLDRRCGGSSTRRAARCSGE